jgi:hypothetical protein
VAWSLNPPGAEVSVLVQAADGALLRVTYLSRAARSARGDDVIAEVRPYALP